jgi:hypothetical protein
MALRAGTRGAPAASAYNLALPEEQAAGRGEAVADNGAAA